ncbi:hypothetical protein KNO15_08885 [Leifsonia shinshuensis]|uniref:hypothetical protein n=1 Tax=Leifsonia shinshuensis TaxID=150026 RepID=UPI001F513E77|nr:hypothetical protein [Leifsonia shinshuensis]MCI0156810.1 hypothetical protein [Leifsonia shinshuensis]
MSTVQTPEVVSVWTENGRPIRLVWRGNRYLVTDTPTPLHESFDHDASTHPAQRIVGWRFQGRSLDDGATRVFDAHQTACTRWVLTGVYT